MERSFLTDVLCPVIPGRLDVLGNAFTKHHWTYRCYLKRAADVVSQDLSAAGPARYAYRPLQTSLLVSVK